jgi:hypothetical protein
VPQFPGRCERELEAALNVMEYSTTRFQALTFYVQAGTGKFDVFFGRIMLSLASAAFLMASIA